MPEVSNQRRLRCKWSDAELQLVAGWLLQADIDFAELISASERTVYRQGRWFCPEQPESPTRSAMVRATLPAIFLDRHPLQTRHPLAAPGREVRTGDTVGLLKTGVLLLPLSAPAAGRLSQPLAAPGTVVGFGTPLVALQAGEETCRST